MLTLDHSIRTAAFDWLARNADPDSGLITWTQLSTGFPYGDTRIPLVTQRGIFKPRQLDIPLSIRTSPQDPYGDAFEGNEVLLYRYFGTVANHRDNAGLREAMRQRLPLVYLKGISPGKYCAVWPVYIIGDDPRLLRFRATADMQFSYQIEEEEDSQLITIRRGYAMAQVRVRLHQTSFRDMIMRAYRSTCSMCTLKHEELLDAAHIIPDSNALGVPEVTNGLALCKIHHAAFDKHILGIDPDYHIEVREDILEEVDGPMLQHGLKEMQGRKLYLPKNAAHYPDRERLEQRFAEFRRAG
ncbi:MAG: HNH endonuclease [Bacteroidia bacterium]|nr:HNH endonuclease [Bacteroidia bacterium]